MAISKTEEKKKARTNPAVRTGIQEYAGLLRCPIIGCLFTSYKRLELIEHLQRFHSKKSLARVVAWYYEKFMQRKLE